MDEAELIFTFFYILLCFCIIYPPTEFKTLGLTIENCFLGSNEIDFIGHHQKRTSLNLVVHSCLPAFYFLIHDLKFTVYDTEGIDLTDVLSWLFNGVAWNGARQISYMAALFVIGLVGYWQQDNWKNHPISRSLMKFTNVPDRHEMVAGDINLEYRRPDVLKIKINSISSVIATDNWIMKTTPYNVYFAHQSDTVLRVDKSETYGIAVAGNLDALQVVSIDVKPGRAGVQDFKIRINALEYLNLEERISRPIVVPSNVEFHRYMIDRFVQVFKDQVSLNPVYEVDQVPDNCFACMTVESNIILTKHCVDQTADGYLIPEQDRCTNCYCRPMWCIDCLARWFATSQSEFDRYAWLEKKGSCPTCRAKFCLLDVSLIKRKNT